MTAPDTVFDVALARVEEVAIGTVCAAAIHSVVFPISVVSELADKVTALAADARKWIADALQPEPVAMPEQKSGTVAAAITGIAMLATNLRFDSTAQRPAGQPGADARRTHGGDFCRWSIRSPTAFTCCAAVARWHPE